MKVSMFVMVGVNVTLTVLSVADPSPEPVAGGAINSASAAVYRAYQYTGFDEIRSLSAAEALRIASMENLCDSVGPVLAGMSVPKRVWRIHLDSVRLALPHKSADRLSEANPKSYDVFLDSLSGCLIKIQTSGPYHPISSMAPPNSGEAVVEVVSGFVTSLPSVTLHQALDNAVGSDPLRAKYVVALLLRQSAHNESQPRVVWQIVGWDIPRDSLSRFPANMRSIIDAETGRPITFDAPPPDTIRIQ